MVEPLVSIIVPVYNAAKHLARCVQSIRAQTWPNVEVLLLNDGSSDVSLDILNMYARTDTRIVVVDKDNRGVSATRNLGLQLARGEYVQFVDADDWLDENATRLMVEKAQKTGADLVIAHYCHVAGSRTSVHGFLEDARPMDQKAFALGLMEEPASFYYGVMWNKLYRADIIHKNDIRCNVETSWSEDFLFNLEYIRYAQRFVALKTPIYYYVYHRTSLAHQKGPVAMAKEKAGLFSYYKGLYEELGLYEAYKVPIHRYLVAFAEHM